MVRLLFLWLWVIFFSGCSSEQTPELQIRALIGRAEEVIEARSLRRVGPLLSDSYQDQQNRNKRDLIGLLGGYFLRNQSIHLLVQIDHIELQDETRARVRLYCALAAQPLADIGQLLALRAALYRFDLTLAFEEEEWRVVGGRWQPATREDFLGIER